MYLVDQALKVLGLCQINWWKPSKTTSAVWKWWLLCKFRAAINDYIGRVSTCKRAVANGDVHGWSFNVSAESFRRI